MKFTIKHSDAARNSFDEYRYEIFVDGKIVAHYWHDYRGDGHGIQFMNGKKENYLPCLMTDFICGGGSEPLTLSEYAVKYIESQL